MYKFVVLASVVVGLLTSTSQVFAGKQLCATKQDKEKVQSFLKNVEAGAPLPVIARDLNIPEIRVVSGVPRGEFVGVKATDESITDVWQSIETWGRTTRVHLVFSINGVHTLNFPSLVPIRQADEGDGFHDVYADGDTGVHAHLFRPEVSSIFAAKLPSNKEDVYARSVNFYDPEGGLIVGVYASMADGKGEAAGISGFETTWKLFEGMPQICR